jgi:hypothetical protein
MSDETITTAVNRYRIVRAALKKEVGKPPAVAVVADTLRLVRRTS